MSASEAVDRCLFACERVALGTTRVPPGSAAWWRVNETAPVRVVTFPRRSFLVRRRGAADEVLHAGTAAVTPVGREYRRRLVDPRGEETDWLWVDEESLARRMRDGAGWRPGRRWLRLLDGPTWLAQRVLVNRARSGAPAAELEERAHLLLAALFGEGPCESQESLPVQRRAVARVVEALIESEGAPVGLETLAHRAGLTPSHLCVVFRRVTGRTISKYANLLRLLAAVQRLDGGDPASGSLVDLAFAVGFSSHSHLSARFRDTFGVTPSEARRRLRRS